MGIANIKQIYGINHVMCTYEYTDIQKQYEHTAHIRKFHECSIH